MIVTTTTDSAEAAQRLAAGAVEARLAACVQISPVTSVYSWKGEIRTDAEYRLDCKTAPDRVDALVEHLRAHHTYDLPEVLVTSVVGGDKDYLGWLISETR
ncbi:periplasmic divalent cation tolerance protein [Crossiella equi]|uniref:Periplasmic divalent cation tolerance protein n=1 Tax=Crossiella equi TaxID=130796 RepID=A0ABS5ANZ4_9PSEU|nr:divalent-cation tolerance protein CutA [Crossiella equi]MBP2478298.1 periplasmic divalent cation tolerance protein [Crossiella equi]